MTTFLKLLFLFICGLFLTTTGIASPLAEKYKERGNSYYARSDYRHAISAYTQAIDEDPNYTAAYFNRGLSYYHAGFYYKSIVDFDKVLSLSPNDPAAFFSRGLAYEKTRQYSLAFSDMNKSADLGDPDAIVLIKSGRLQKKITKQTDNKDKRDFGIRTTVTTFQKGDMEYEGAEGIYQKKDMYNNQGEKIKTVILHTAWYNNDFHINKSITFFGPSGIVLKRENYLTGRKLGSKEIITYTPDGHVKEKQLVNLY